LTTGISDKFATGVNVTGGKIAAVSTHRWQICRRYQRHRRQILPPVSLVLLIRGKFATGINDTGGKFATGVIDTGGKQCD
jgi:hypothetical protein